MIFVDTNVVMYAVGRHHPLQAEARAFFKDARDRELRLCTNAEVLQELLYAYLPMKRFETLDAALLLLSSFVPTTWSMDAEDVSLARTLAGAHPKLSSRDLVHLASCRRRGVLEVKTFDRGLHAAFKGAAH
jgi:uncharacterized protein